jgi:hypothetical protein
MMSLLPGLRLAGRDGWLPGRWAGVTGRLPEWGHDGRVEELILRTVVIQFDGRVVEVFGDHSNEVVRAHVALMKEPQILGPNRKGRRLVSVGATTIGVDDDEWARLTPLLDTIRAAIRAARNAAPA